MSRTLIFPALLLGVFALLPSGAHAATYFYDFDGINSYERSGSPTDWVNVNQNAFNITTTRAFSGTHSFESAATFSGDSKGILFDDNTEGTIYAEFYPDSSGSGYLGTIAASNDANTNNESGYGIDIYADGHAELVCTASACADFGSNVNVPGQISLNAWNYARIDWKQESGNAYVRYWINSYTSGWLLADNGAAPGITAVQVRSNQPNNGKFFIDDVGTATDADTLGDPIDPPTTEWNEVIDYIYDPVLDNSFGTSTVGARFSIAEPDWLTNIGVELRGPLGNILWSDEFSPSEPGTYDVDTDYYFDTSGAYELQAYFIRDTGERVDNLVSVYITVNVPQWTFDPVSGDLVPVASTTIGTSTLTNFKVDCPDDVLVGSLCKLAVGLFVPKASSIQSLQASFYGLLEKAPFSFFTQSKTVLDSFRAGSAATGGSLALDLYEREIQIVSSSTAASLGVDSSMIDFLKGIMVVGLWLMLAWYLYWRIASIFGV